MILENKPMARSGAGYDWDDYYGYEEIVSFMEGLAANDDDINVIDIGKTYEGRDMKVKKIDEKQNHQNCYLPLCAISNSIIHLCKGNISHFPN